MKVKTDGQTTFFFNKDNISVSGPLIAHLLFCTFIFQTTSYKSAWEGGWKYPTGINKGIRNRDGPWNDGDTAVMNPNFRSAAIWKYFDDLCKKFVWKSFMKNYLHLCMILQTFHISFLMPLRQKVFERSLNRIWAIIKLCWNQDQSISKPHIAKWNESFSSVSFAKQKNNSRLLVCFDFW